MPVTSIEELVECSTRRCNAIPDWLDACNVDPSPFNNAWPALSLTLRRRNELGLWSSSSDPSRTLSFSSRSRSVPPSFMDDLGKQSRRGRRPNRGVTTRSREGKKKAEAISQSGTFPKTHSAPTTIEAVGLDQLQLHESCTTVSSELDLRASTTLSHTFTATGTKRSGLSRSLSPTKKISDLMAAKPPIKVGAAMEVPQYVEELLTRFAGICGGDSVLPRSLKVEWRLCICCSGFQANGERLQTELDKIDRRNYQDFFFDDPVKPDVSYDLEVFEKLRLLREAALNCYDREKPEPSWGEAVFYPMLNLAVELENRDNVQNVQVENVTTTQISPKSLVPTGLQDLAFTSKRVDYCIYLSQTETQESHTRDLLTLRNIDINDHGINQAGSSSYAKWLPQLAAVECKSSVPGADGAVQLGVWMAALRKQLEALMKQEKVPKMHLKPMPCLKAEGLHWYMYWCFIGDKGETALYGPEDLGSAKEMKGLYQILTALREIVKYGRDEYWPWFKEMMLWEKD
ncbi:hypothetical protein EMCG_01265 [[Emmonsia] crescens]|uniref:PD-(D/E)XK nuclease-like domain-containing protein n=1 Tax=[Emmonsia] crescens TaxID=73230 RepID=A0A0G2I5H7_9EURO|nr:hypothetical protein EMCG_01265 [Emmonsia crescens UAMH 3008]